MDGANPLPDALKQIFNELNALSKSTQRSVLPRRIELCRKALEIISKDTRAELWGMLHDDLGNSLLNCPSESRAQNIEDAIRHFEQALEVRTIQTHPAEWASTHNNLGNAYCDRIEGDRARNVEEAIRHYELALEVRTRQSDPDGWAMTQFNLADTYYKRIAGDRAENLEQAIHRCEQSITVYTREAFPQQWAQAHNTLGGIYRVRITGPRMQNIEASIDHFQQALLVFDFQRFPEDWARIHNNLAVAYSDRIRGEKAENMEQSIDHSMQALEVRTRASDPNGWAKTQFNLGNAYRFRIRGDPAENMERAIHHFEQALQVHTQLTFPEDWARARNHLGSAYLGRSRDGRADNLEMAIRCSKDVLEVYTRETFPEEWAQTQNNLGNAYFARRRGNQANNIEESIHYYNQALIVRTRQAFPTDWAEIQNNLAIAYTFRIQGRRSENIEHAIHHFQQALEVYTCQAFPDHCLKTARGLGNLAFEEQRWELVTTAYATVFEAHNLLMQASLSRAGQQIELGEVESLPPREAYAHIKLGNIEPAVAGMEQGRAQLLRDSLERQRQDLTLLGRLGFEDIYQEYMQASQEQYVLQRMGASESTRSTEWMSQMERAQERVQVATAAIRREAGREHPQYRYFLQALPFPEIKKQAGDRPLVYLSATPAGGFALIVTDRGAQWLELPALNEAALQGRIGQLSGDAPEAILTHVQSGRITREDIQAVRGGYFSMYGLWSLARDLTNTPDELKEELSRAWQQTLDDTTRWLWDVGMGKLVSSIKEQSDCVTLIPSGQLALLPLHAAWTEDRSSSAGRRYVLDELNVTYAPSAHALWQASLGAGRPTESLMVVENPDGTLPWAGDEVRTALNLFANVTHLSGKEAIPTAVKQSMQTANVLHFATHGQAGWLEEELARLKLADGDLTLPEIHQLHLRGTRLAVLSACETGVPGLKLIDEMIGLPAGMMQAGVPGVVGSLWSVDDGSTALLMHRFYALWRNEGMHPREALRQAQIWLRDNLLESPYHWAAFTYTGV